MGVDCLKCINSACCKLKITIDKKEYESLKPKIKNEFVRHTDIFIQKNPKYKNKANQIDLMYIDNYAVMKKGNDGFCNFLDRCLWSYIYTYGRSPTLFYCWFLRTEGNLEWCSC